MSVTASEAVETGSKVVTVTGCLDESEGAEVHRLVNRALIRTPRQLTLDLAGVAAFTPEGILEVAEAVTVGCRLPGGLRIRLGSLKSRAAVVALCRWGTNRLVWEGTLAGDSVKLRP
jgi:hypothetical protein